MEHELTQQQIDEEFGDFLIFLANESLIHLRTLLDVDCTDKQLEAAQYFLEEHEEFIQEPGNDNYSVH
jgi:hypothetical protein